MHNIWHLRFEGLIFWGWKDSDLNSLPKSPKKDDDTQANFTSRLKDVVMSPFSKGKGDQKLPREGHCTLCR